MLTKDLLRYKTRKESIHPIFIDPSDESFRELAQLLIDIFSKSEGIARENLLSESKQIIDNHPCEAVISRGLEKLLLDRTEFFTAPNEELIQKRKKLFELSAELLRKEQWENLQIYQNQLEKQIKEPFTGISEHLYGDLPPYQPVVRFKTFSPEKLLHRYNCAQVQGLLIRCQELQIRITDSPAASLRQLFKYLRFHQLLAKIHAIPDENEIFITIDGPLNLFYQTQKYGLNLAKFFPAILHQNIWMLTAVINISRHKQYILKLDHNDGLRSHFKQFLDYVPEEVELFQKFFYEKVKTWKIEPAGKFLPFEGEYYCFPDYTLESETGMKIDLEFFHNWHASQISPRLEQLKNISEPVIILGVNRNLKKDPAIAKALDESEYFSKYGFIFREIPSVEKILTILERISISKQ